MLDFLTALKVNNDRQWFAAHKEEYNDIRRQCLEEVGVLIAEIERFDPHLAGVAPEPIQCVTYKPEYALGADHGHFTYVVTVLDRANNESAAGEAINVKQ